MRRACFARVEELRAARAAREERRIPVFTEKTDSPLLGNFRAEFGRGNSPRVI